MINRYCYLYNGSAWLSEVELDIPIEGLTLRTLEYVISQAVKKDVNFMSYTDDDLYIDYKNDKTLGIIDNNITYDDYIESMELYNIDLCEYNLNNLYIDLTHFRLKPITDSLMLDSLYVKLYDARRDEIIERGIKHYDYSTALNTLKDDELIPLIDNMVKYDYKIIEYQRIVNTDDGYFLELTEFKDNQVIISHLIEYHQGYISHVKKKEVYRGSIK